MAARRLVTALAVAAAIVAGPLPGFAHPMGNFSISHYTELRVGADGVGVRYILDLAEIPTFQEIQETGIVAVEGHPGLAPYLARQAETFKEGLWLELDGRRLPLVTGARQVIFPPGVGGLPTMKIGVDYHVRLEVGAGPHVLTYADRNFPDRVGWKEIVATAGAAVRFVSTTAPATSRSRELSDYPTDLLESPPQDLAARIVFSREGPAMASVPPPAAADRGVRPAPPGGQEPRRLEPPGGRELQRAEVSAERAGSTEPPAQRDAIPREAAVRAAPVTVAALQPNVQAPTSALADLVATSRQGLGLMLGALVVAMTLGAAHALEPGHGKTVVAAYLVGSRGTARHAVFLGLVVTASHTAAVYLLGGVTLYASRYVVPEKIYPWLGAASGLLIAGLGLVLFIRRSRRGHAHDHGHHHHGLGDHDHDHAHPHDHGHGTHAHAPDGDGHHHAGGPHAARAAPGGRVSLGQLFALGVSGGIVPCPAALVVLLSALAMRQVGFGLLLIVAFSLGLAAVLIAIGLLMVYAGRVMARFHGDGPLLTRWLPMASAAVITVLGVAIAVQALAAAGIVRLSL
jgi:nickel/cobalt exporter